jgi:CDP-glucose 4,6-dehydratase
VENLVMHRINWEFWKGRRVFVTGHTGFKGTWLARILVVAGADVTGYSLPPPTEPNLFSHVGLESEIHHRVGDIRDFSALKAAFDESCPEIVLHLAAQPIVREGYRMPRETYEVNVMGTVNLLECARLGSNVKSIVNVTTDKVYFNDERTDPFRENDVLDGYDPYSNSKSCSELVSGGYNRSFFSGMQIALSTARAGNVIGGGDFGYDRIIPDCVRSVFTGQRIKVRNPYSVRPYQHVLEPLAMYLRIAESQYGDMGMAGAYNIGPDGEDSLSTGELVDLFCRKWGDGAQWESCAEAGAPHEAGLLRLDNEKIKKVFGWRARWTLEECMDRVCEFYRLWNSDGDIVAEMDYQIKEFFNDTQL